MMDKGGNIIPSLQRNTFNKRERLCSKNLIGQLFDKGDSFLCYPLKVVFLKTELPADVPVQAAFSVGKRNIQSAVKRNQVKRKIKEY